MIPAPSLDEIAKMLNEDHPWGKSGPLTPIDKKINVLGVLLIPPDTAERNTSNLLHNIELLSKDSGTRFHFLLVGISQYGGDREVGQLGGRRIFFNEDKFSEFCKDLERKIPRWHYDYTLELLLFDLRGEQPNRSINFESYINFKLSELIEADIFENPAQFLGKIIKLARESNLDSVGDIRGHFQSQFGVNWVKAIILSLFPKSIQKLARVNAVLGGGRPQITPG